jgi:hypothetical protein
MRSQGTGESWVERPLTHDKFFRVKDINKGEYDGRMEV